MQMVLENTSKIIIFNNIFFINFLIGLNDLYL